MPGMDAMVWMAAGYGALVGAVLASGTCVAVERGVRAFLTDARRSQCACGRTLKAAENIPIVGWLRVRGVARCCGARIPAWYLWAEVAGLLVGARGAAVLASLAAGGAGPWALVLAGSLAVAACVIVPAGVARLVRRR